MLTRDMIAEAIDYEMIEKEIPEWGGTIFLRSMTAHNYDAMQVWFARFGGEKGSMQVLLREEPELLNGLKTTLISYCLCDKDGTFLFDDEEGRAILQSKSGTVIDRLYDAAMALNKLTEEEIVDEKKD